MFNGTSSFYRVVTETDNLRIHYVLLCVVMWPHSVRYCNSFGWQLTNNENVCFARVRLVCLNCQMMHNRIVLETHWFGRLKWHSLASPVRSALCQSVSLLRYIRRSPNTAHFRVRDNIVYNSEMFPLIFYTNMLYCVNGIVTLT